ncbi:MAG: cysteine peptidase family C39 domain-containing protein [Phycisphaerae bacterium]|nr:cysteine peptidase family C39 domain-containing protein [Phycisphaerae bacterium]MDD5380135.1 cysteine peptidase family C39 domain-containing protein [Phycisphaerae bacterium]
MKTRNFMSIAVFLLFVSGAAFADRPLERKEILQIFQKITNQPRKTWIPAGTIEAAHEEYRAPKMMDADMVNDQINKDIQQYQDSPNKRELTEELQKMRLDAEPFNTRYRLSNEYTMSSKVIVKFDGDRFYWEINVNSRTDSVRPGKELAGNYMTEQFNLDWNARRIFAWDGEKYTTYFLPGNHAIVDTTGRIPHVVNGSLTAGLIPWGYGFYSYDNLAAADAVAIEKQINGQTQISLTLNNPDGLQMEFVMDPQKDYAVISCLTSRDGVVISSKQYSNYQLTAGGWIPFTILLEQYETGSKRLLARDLWDITSIDSNAPESYDFEVIYEADALIERFSLSGGKSETYRYSQGVDTNLLLTERLAYAASESAQPRNCATAALKYITSQLGKNITDQQFAQLVNGPDKSTNLYEMKQFAQGMGLHCRAVKTDVQTLKKLHDCKAILHIPGRKHFVALETIDAKYVWTVDLASNQFYCRTDIDSFPEDWIGGIAILISNTEDAIKGEFAEIDESELRNIIGASGYKCNLLKQEWYIIYCVYAGGCGGECREFFTRLGCGVAASGNCYQYPMPRYRKSPCMEVPGEPGNCTDTGEWTYYYMQACA